MMNWRLVLCFALMISPLLATDEQARVAVEKAVAHIKAGGTTLDLRSGAGHYVGDAGAITICKALVAHDGGKVKMLDLSVSDIGMAGAEAVASMLSNNTQLEDLRIGWNEFGADGVCCCC